jgi:aldehyde dehydrogenase (NAD+)/betaine-aldehyde dehydrogenase
MTKIQNFKMYIDGQWVDSETGRTIETLNPENNEVWATVPEASAKDVDRAVKSAQNAFEVSWANLHPRDRAKYLRVTSKSIEG